MNIFKKIKRDWKVRSIVKNVAYSHRSELNELGYEVAPNGTIYTLVNIDKKLYSETEGKYRDYQERDQKLSARLQGEFLDLSALLVKLKIVDLVTFPDHIDQIDDTGSFIVKFEADQTFFTKRTLYKFLIGFFLSIVIAFIIYQIVK